MKPVEGTHKERGYITSVQVGGGGDGPDTVWVGISLGDNNGAFQAFGGLSLPTEELRASFITAVADAFGVSDGQKLAGKPCYALRSFNIWGDTICGLESVDTGRKMTVRAWRVSRGMPAISAYEERTAQLNTQVEAVEAQLQELKSRQAKAAELYFEWE
jgi:hypothetical protein